ncbi:MAG TPA: hypothetical protein DCW42_05880 [Bacteroidetes bacterium]|nr:hypothetical protein [Bacteroidota bacterium]
MKMRSMVIVLLFCSTVLFAQDGTEKKNVAITIYNQNLGVVNETRSIFIPKNLSDVNISDIPTSINPTSVHFKFDGEVYEQNYRYDLVSMAKLLQKYIDKQITIIKGDVKESGTLLSIQDRSLIIKTGNGLKVFPDFNQYQITVDELPSGLLTKPTLVWKVFSKNEGKQDIDISYSVRDIKWDAKYVAVLNDEETQMDFNSWVSIDNNSGGNYENAKLKLIAGDVNITRGYGDFQVFTESNAARTQESPLMAKRPKFEEEKFFEYHIYELDQPTTILNNEIKQVSLFNIQKVKVQKKYSCFQDYSQNSDEKKNVNVLIYFKNEKQNGLGIPLPAGMISVFKTRNNTAELIGEDNIQHTPKDEEIELNLGKAFDITYTEKLTSSNKSGEKSYVDQYILEFFNHTDKEIEIEVNRWAPGDWVISDSNYNFEKKDAHNVRFKIKVPTNGTNKLNYTIRYSI